MVRSTTTTSSSDPEIQLVIPRLERDLPVGSSIVLYLEDDFEVPNHIPASSAYLVSEPPKVITGNGARVYTTTSSRARTDGYFDLNEHDISIQVLVPDMCTYATNECEGSNGLHQGDRVTLVIRSDSGIKNPSEEGSYRTGYAILDPTDRFPGRDGFTKLNNLRTFAKISLSNHSGGRGAEITVTGSGFNDGITAAVYVLSYQSLAPGTLDNGVNEAALCDRIINDGTRVGSAVVGSDDRVSVTFQVTAPAFQPGNANYICVVDGEGRMSSTDVEVFNLEHSIRAVPSSVSVGDTVTVFAQDFPNPGAGFTSLTIAGQVHAPDGTALTTFVTNSSSIGADGGGTVSFEIPDGFQGIVQLRAKWGDIEASTNITIHPSGLTEPQFVGPVTNLTVSTLSLQSGSVRLTWTPALNAQVHFALYVRSADVLGGNYATAQMVPFHGSEGVISGLEAGTGYHFIVIGMRWNWINYGPVWGTWSSWRDATPQHTAAPVSNPASQMPCIIIGVVTDDVGPVRNAPVFAVSNDGNNRIVAEDRSDREGRYELSITEFDLVFDLYVGADDTGVDTPRTYPGCRETRHLSVN